MDFISGSSRSAFALRSDQTSRDRQRLEQFPNTHRISLKSLSIFAYESS